MEHKGNAILIDCGEGTQIALKKSKCKLSRLQTLLITHFHADHIAGLPGLLLTLGNSGKTTPLTIVGPVGLKHVVSSLAVIAPVLPYPIQLNELDMGKTGEMENDEIIISYLPLDHGISCFGYCITVKRKPIFNPQKANQLGIPKTLFKSLHAGKSIQLENEQIIEPEMVLDGKRHPIRVCYCTDTRKVDTMTDFARGADLLIGEGMYGDNEMRDKMVERGHMLFCDSALLAKEADAQRLWLTHFSPALTKPEHFLDSARQIFPQTVVAYDGIHITL